MKACRSTIASSVVVSFISWNQRIALSPQEIGRVIWTRFVQNVDGRSSTAKMAPKQPRTIRSKTSQKIQNDLTEGSEEPAVVFHQR
jgi:hypothetical protein